MNTISSEEHRTRTYHSPERRQSHRGPFDEQFERELPPGIRAQFEQNFPRSVNRRPMRPSVSVPPPVSSSTSRESRGGGGSWVWWLLAVTIGLPLLFARFSDDRQPIASSPAPGEIQQTPPSPAEIRRALPVIEVRRAAPVALRALPLDAVEPAIPTVGWQLIRMPDGHVIPVHYEGELSSSAALPPQGRFVGQAFSTQKGNTWWIWSQPTGASLASWVDP